HTSSSGDDLGSAVVSSQLPRLQAPALELSACYRKSDLSCLTCHDPHRDALDRSPVRYNRICASCHTRAAPAQTSCKVQPRRDCVSCHMPLQTVGLPTAPRYHNHWIGIWGARPAPPRTL